MLNGLCLYAQVGFMTALVEAMAMRLPHMQGAMLSTRAPMLTRTASRLTSPG